MNKIDEIILEFEGITKLLKEASAKWDRLSSKETRNDLNLTAKEIDIHGLFKTGLDIEQISDQLKISPKTVTVHRDRIRKKMGLKSAKDFYRTLKEKR